MRSEKKEIVKDAKRNTQILQITLLITLFYLHVRNAMSPSRFFEPYNISYFSN